MPATTTLQQSPPIDHGRRLVGSATAYRRPRLTALAALLILTASGPIAGDSKQGDLDRANLDQADLDNPCTPKSAFRGAQPATASTNGPVIWTTGHTAAPDRSAPSSLLARAPALSFPAAGPAAGHSLLALARQASLPTPSPWNDPTTWNRTPASDQAGRATTTGQLSATQLKERLHRYHANTLPSGVQPAASIPTVAHTLIQTCRDDARWSVPQHTPTAAG